MSISFEPIAEILDGMTSDGVAYIDTGYYPTTGVTEIYAEFTPSMSTGVRRDLLGCYTSEINVAPTFGFRITAADVLFADMWKVSTSTGISSVVGTKYTVVADATTGSINGTQISITQASGNTLSNTFCIARASSSSYVAKGVKFGVVKIGENGEWLRDLVPVRILATDEICAYDYATKQYYKNAATSGSFTAHYADNPSYIYDLPDGGVIVTELAITEASLSPSTVAPNESFTITVTATEVEKYLPPVYFYAGEILAGEA